MNKNVKVGDTIKLHNIEKYKINRHNDRSSSEVRQIFLSNDYVYVVKKNSKSIIIACYDGDAYPNDNFYVITLIDGLYLSLIHISEPTRPY